MTPLLHTKAVVQELSGHYCGVPPFLHSPPFGLYFIPFYLYYYPSLLPVSPVIILLPLRPRFFSHYPFPIPLLRISHFLHKHPFSLYYYPSYPYICATLCPLSLFNTDFTDIRFPSPSSLFYITPHDPYICTTPISSFTLFQFIVAYYFYCHLLSLRAACFPYTTSNTFLFPILLSLAFHILYYFLCHPISYTTTTAIPFPILRSLPFHFLYYFPWNSLFFTSFTAFISYITSSVIQFFASFIALFLMLLPFPFLFHLPPFPILLSFHVSYSLLVLFVLPF